MEIKELKAILSKVINPTTGASLESEKRFDQIKIQEEKVYISYDRTSIGPVENKEIQNSIFKILETDFKEENILVMPTSKNSSEVYSSHASSAQPAAKNHNSNEQANLKVGHSTVAPQKSLANVKHVIAVGSGKGGVGKSTVSVNLALSLINAGYKVGLIDADIYGPSIPRAMGKEGQQVFTDDDKKIIPLESFGLKFISFGLFIKENDPVIWRGPMLGGVLNQFFFDVKWGDLDYMIIDLPPGTGDVQLSMIQKLKVDGAIIVSTPQDFALLDARRAFHMFKKMKLPVLGVIENMSAFVCDGCGKEHQIYGDSKITEFADQEKLKFLGSIPFEVELGRSCDSGVPFMSQEKMKGTKVWDSYKNISNSIIN